MEKDGKRIQQQVFASWDNFITLKCQKIHRFAETACITDLKAWITAYLNTHVFVEFSIDIEREREKNETAVHFSVQVYASIYDKIYE